MLFVCIVGILESVLSAIVACADRRRRRPLFIAQGLMCGDSFLFFSSFCLVVSVLECWTRASVWCPRMLALVSLGAARVCRSLAFSSWRVILCGVSLEWPEDLDCHLRIPHLSFVVRLSLLWGTSPGGKSELRWLCDVSAVRIVVLF
jgi:hypothetical protein